VDNRRGDNALQITKGQKMTEQPVLKCPHCGSELKAALNKIGQPALWAAPAAQIITLLGPDGKQTKGINAQFSPSFAFHIYKCTSCTYLEMRDYGEDES
jgi:DNA-directed RNA polymerase subunit RPC12/RpoP